MIHFSYTRQYDGQFYKTGSFNNNDWVTLCGAEVDHDTDMKDGKLCEDCIKVMWQEQYRRNLLASSGPTDLIPEVTGDPEMESQDDSPLYLSAYEIET